MCGLDENSKEYHHETEPSAISKSEAAVQRTLEAFEGFMNPFSMDDKTRLYNISSYVAVSKEIEHDVLRVEKVG